MKETENKENKSAENLAEKTQGKHAPKEQKLVEERRVEGEYADKGANEEVVAEDMPVYTSKRKRRSMKERVIEEATDLDKPFFTKLHIILMLLVICLFLGTVAVITACAIWLQDLPDYTDADSFNTIKPTEVYASDHTTLLARFQLENRDPLDSLNSVSKYVISGTVATEDVRFYSHGGVDFIGMARAVLNNVLGGSREGGSTITQQLVRNSILLDEMDDISLKRKVREAYLAMEMEKLYSKEDILLRYLNTINYGGGAYGIEAAAKRYFSKSASELTLAESALLVGIPQSPVSNSPLYYPDNAKERRDLVLDRMVENGSITKEQAEAAKAEPINLNPSEPSADGIVKYPYFASYVRDQLTNNKTYGLSATDIFKGGLTVYTTLDVDAQEKAEAAATQAEGEMNSALKVGMTAVDPNTGYIKAMVGGDDYYERQWNLATQEARQPGSSFKTFTLITALEQGISPNTNVSCSSTVTIGSNKTIENINKTSYGTKTISGAFAVSSNTAFARLCAVVTPEAVSETAHKMGITSDLDPVLSITLGTSDVTTLEMADAYATIANGGTHYDAIAVQQVLDRKGNTIVDSTKPNGERVLSKEVACAARKVMEGVVNNGTGTAARINTGQSAAGKTGTSENYMDSYFAGFTPELSVAVWIGDPNREVAATSITGAHVFGYFMNSWCAERGIVEFMEAADPEYTKTFNNTDLDLPNVSSYQSSGNSSTSSRSNSYYYSGQTNSSTESSQSSSRNSSSSSSSGSSGGSGSGGGSSSGGGDSSGGGSSGGGDSGGGGSSGGGSSGGGSSSGGGN